MNLIDRLITKAHTIQLTYGDNVFIISHETGGWVVDGQTFPDLEAAQGYVERLIPDGILDSTVIINDLGPSVFVPEKNRGKRHERWLEKIREERERKERGGLDPPMPKKDRNLI